MSSFKVEIQSKFIGIKNKIFVKLLIYDLVFSNINLTYNIIK
jgi:hypothetical protein